MRAQRAGAVTVLSSKSVRQIKNRTREAGSACAVKTINSCLGCAVMAFTAEEVISMLNDTYEDNSDDD